MTPALYWEIRALEGDAQRLHAALQVAEQKLAQAYARAKLDPAVRYVRNDETTTMIPETR